MDRTAILKAIRRGAIVARRLGKAWVIDLAEVVNYEPRRAPAVR